MIFSEYGQGAYPLKARKGEPGKRGMRILETEDEKNNMLIAIGKNKPHIAKNALSSIAYKYVIANNC